MKKEREIDKPTIDRFTSSNPYIIGEQTEEQKSVIGEVNREISEAHAKNELTPGEAWHLARAEREDINFCTEYTDAFVFTNSDDPHTIGGLPCPIAVMKKTGEVMHFQQYVDKHILKNGSEIVREFEV